MYLDNSMVVGYYGFLNCTSCGGLLFVLVFTTKGCLTCVFAYFHGCGLSYGFIFVILLAFLPLLKISSIVEFIDCPICFSVIGELFICCYFELDNCSFVVTFHWTIHEDKIVMYLNPRLKLVSTSISKLALLYLIIFVIRSQMNDWPDWPPAAFIVRKLLSWSDAKALSHPCYAL